jgi:hypothetical protein
MNWILFTAAVLAALTAGIHIFAGGTDIAAPLLASSLGDEVRLTLYAVWHMVSVTLVLSAMVLALGANPRHAFAARHAVLFTSALWTGFGAVFLVIVLTRPGEGLLWKLPQWVLFLPVGLFGLWGSRAKPLTVSETTR